LSELITLPFVNNYQNHWLTYLHSFDEEKQKNWGQEKLNKD
jgi:hypothetical protein